MATAAQIVKSLVEDDLDAPDLAHWGERLSVESRLDKLFGPSREYMSHNPGQASEWSKVFQFGAFKAKVYVTMWYKVKNAPSVNVGYEVNNNGFRHNDSEMLHGREHILKLVEYLEQGVARLNANPPKKDSDVIRVFHEILRYAFMTEQGEPYDPS